MIPAHYLELIEPLDGVQSMLELGNKRGTGGPGDTYKRHFEALGIRHLSVDRNGEDGALPLDLQEPLLLGMFDMVTNIGTSEHVENQGGVWRNIVTAAAKFAVCITPRPGDWPGHGLFYPTPLFYQHLADENGFALERCYTAGPPGRAFVYARLRRRVFRDHVTVPVEHLTAAPPRASRR